MLARPVVAGALVGGLAGHLPYSLDDVAESANAIRRQQGDLGRWARDALPPDAVIGVNDTGAIAYFSGRRTFDVVGLTTLGEGRYWVAGAGSRFEHYERLGVKRLPTHFIVYPEWFAIPTLEGEWLTERRVSATILGGENMVASKADWSTLGSGERPREAPLAWTSWIGSTSRISRARRRDELSTLLRDPGRERRDRVGRSRRRRRAAAGRATRFDSRRPRPVS